MTYLLRLAWWSKLTGNPEAGKLLGRLADWTSWAPWAAVLVCLPYLLFFFRPYAARIAVWTMAQTGGAAMALQMAVIFMFQSRFGVVYRDIGLLNALFMAGWRRAACSEGGCWAAGSARPPCCPAWSCCWAWSPRNRRYGLARARSAFAWAVGVGGIAVRAGIRDAFALYLEDRSRPEVSRALAGLEAADHLGAVAGSLLGGLIPSRSLDWIDRLGARRLKLLGGLVLLNRLDR